jgi:protein-tyrosine phosphatase
MHRLCFVCLGNICRSPTAEGVMVHLVEQAGLTGQFFIDSAGTSAYHVGEPADARSQAAAKIRGVQLRSVARQFEAADFERFDYVLAMDQENMRALGALVPDRATRKKLHLLRSFDAQSPVGAGVPDPYYGGGRGFDEVFDICFAACQGLLAHLTRARS